MSKYFLSLLIVMILVPAIAFSQGATTAAVNGLVSDESGKPLVGATVKVLHIPSGTLSGAITNGSGRYNVLNLRVGGPYQVKVSMVGYDTASKYNVYLAVTQNLNIDFKLNEKGVTTNAVEVVAQRNEIISSDRTGAANVVSEKDIRSMPSISRSIQDFTRLSPYIATSSTNGSSNGSNVGGRNSKYNNIQVDGAILSDAFGLASNGTPGGQAGAEPISLDAIQEFQVQIAPYDVRLGGFTGGLINAVTRGGTNTFEGSAYLLGRNQRFVANSPVPDALGNRNPYPSFGETYYGGRLGGPIMENQLFFFASAETRDRNDPQVLGLRGESAANVFDFPKDSLRIIRDSVKSRYGFDPGAYDQFTRNTNDYKIFLRFDYNISPEHRLTLRNNYVNAAQDNAVLRDRNNFSFQGQDYIFRSQQNQTVLQLNSVFGNDMANEFRLAYTSIRDKRDYQSNPFPAIDILNVGADRRGTIKMGVERFSQANSLDQDIFELTDNFNWFMGDHVITLGTSNQMVSFKNVFIQDYFGYYQFQSFNDFLNAKPSAYSLSYANTAATGGETQPAAKFTYLNFSFYAQDEWSVMQNFKLTIGLRYDAFTYSDTPLENDKFAAAFPGYQTSKMPTPGALSPRVGFNWDVFNDKQTQIRGGIGMFAGRTPGVWIGNQFANTGVDILRVDERKNPPQFSADPNNQPKPGVDPNLTPITTAEVNITDKDFKMPQILRASIGVDQELGEGFIGTLEFFYGKAVNDVLFKNILLQDSLVGGQRVYAQDGRPLYSNVPISKNFTRVMLLTNTSEGTQSSFTVQIQKPYNQGIIPNLSLNLAYTNSSATDVNSATSSRAISNWQFNPAVDPNNPEAATSNFEIKNRILANLTYTLEHGEGYMFNFGVFYEGRSGSPFSMLWQTSSGSDPNNDFYYSNDLSYIPSGPNDPHVVLTSKNWDDLEAFINAFDGLKDNKGTISKRNSLVAPWIDQLDFRFSEVIPIWKTHKLEISLDFLNVLNLLNNDWGHQLYMPFGTYNMIQYQGIVSQADIDKGDFTQSDLGKMKASFKLPGGKTKDTFTADDIFSVDDFQSRWQLQLGIRYTF